jgi:PAS domain S-box-containing protein
VAGPEGLTNPLLQQTLMAEAIATAVVGFVVWDDDRRYVAANAAACELLGCTLEQIVGSTVGDRTEDGAEVVAGVIREQRSGGRVTVQRFDGAGSVVLEYLTFSTRAVGLPYMASVIWPAEETN